MHGFHFVASLRHEFCGLGYGVASRLLCGEAAGHTGALGQVVVIGTAATGFQVPPGSGRRTGVHLHPAVHLSAPSNNGQLAEIGTYIRRN
jgi:hypothetical protein